VDGSTLLIGIVAIALGLGLMLLGYRLALTLLPIWGFVAGFWFSVQALETLLGDGLLATSIGWVVAAVIGLAFAVLSYLFWYAAVVIAFASVGYWLGWAVLTLIGFSGTGLAGLGISLVVGAAFAVVAIVTGVPLVALVVVTALGGAHAVVAGVLILLGAIDVTSLGSGVANAILAANPGWWLATLGLALVAMTVQLRTIGEFELQPPTARL